MASNGKRMVREDLIKKLEEISLNPVYETLSFKNDNNNITFGYISESDPYLFGANLALYDTFTLKETYTASGVEPVQLRVNIPNAYSLYPNNQLRTNFYTALGAKVGSTTVYAGNDGVVDLSAVVSETPHLYKYTFSFDFSNFDDDPSTNVNYFWGIVYSSYNAIGDNGRPALTDITDIMGSDNNLNVAGTVHIGNTVYTSTSLYGIYYDDTDDSLMMDIYYPANPSAGSFTISNVSTRYPLSITKQQLF